MDELVKAEIESEWSTQKLLEKYETLRRITLDNLPNLWFGLEFALSIKSILNIKGCTLPFAGILLGPSSSLKTLIIECFRDYPNTFYTDNFSPKAFVSHISGKTEEQLRKDDMLPRVKNKFFMTPELAPVFSAREDDLIQLLGIMTRVLDGQGYESDTGACGHRGYDEEIMFTWLGAAVDIPYKVHKLLGTLGPKLYFFRLPRIEQSEDDYFETREEDFSLKKQNVRKALFEYLQYFDFNPYAEEIQRDIRDYSNKAAVRATSTAIEEKGLIKIALDPKNDEELAHRVIIRIAKLLARLRAIVPTWETKDTQGSDYAYGLANIEDPSRAITQLRNLARGHALSMGRGHITLDDIPIIIHAALSTATIERVRMFELLIAFKGELTTNQICDSLNTTPPTARRTMTELKATGLVTMDIGSSSASSTITLKPEFDWFLTLEFLTFKERNNPDLLKEKCPPQKGYVSTSVTAFSGGKISFNKSSTSVKPVRAMDT
jgi:hypothetical protein